MMLETYLESYIEDLKSILQEIDATVVASIVEALQRARVEQRQVLIIGNGGREHALAWKCAQSPRVTEVLVAPGNAGTAREPKVRNVPIGVEQMEQLANLAAAEGVALTSSCAVTPGSARPPRVITLALTG